MRKKSPPPPPLGFRGVARAESSVVPGWGDPIQRSLCPSFPSLHPLPSPAPHWVSCKGQALSEAGSTFKMGREPWHHQKANRKPLAASSCLQSLLKHPLYAFPEVLSCFLHQRGRGVTYTSCPAAPALTQRTDSRSSVAKQSGHLCKPYHRKPSPGPRNSRGPNRWMEAKGQPPSRGGGGT